MEKIMVELKEGDRIIRANSIEYLKDTIKIPQAEHFAKMYALSIPLLHQCKLTSAEYSIMLYLASNLRYKSNAVQYENGKLITRQALAKDMGLNDETVKRSIRTLIKEGILIEVSSTSGNVFVMNPYIFNVGETINRTIHDLFKSTRWSRDWSK
jgi:biotin operon repressor